MHKGIANRLSTAIRFRNEETRHSCVPCARCVNGRLRTPSAACTPSIAAILYAALNRGAFFNEASLVGSVHR